MENNVTIQGFELPQIQNSNSKDYTLIEINSNQFFSLQSVLEEHPYQNLCALILNFIVLSPSIPMNGVLYKQMTG